MFKSLVCIISIFCLLQTGCTKKENKTNSDEIAFSVMGRWEIPPAYHGNPFSPGGVGRAFYYIFGNLAIYNPTQENYTNFIADSFNLEDSKLTVKLKKGFFWDDGTQFTSTDVKADFIIKGALGNITHVLNYIDSIDTPDADTIVFNLDENYPPLMITYILTNYIVTPYHIYKKWADSGEELVKSRKNNLTDTQEFSDLYTAYRESLFSYKPKMPLGYGPYKLTRLNASEMRLEAVDKYPGGTDNIKVKQVKISNSGVTWMLLKNNELDFLEAVASPDVVDPLIKDNNKVKQVIVPSMSNIGLWMNETRYPFNELNFRKAIAHIIDRKKLREIAFYFCKPIIYSTGISPVVSEKWINSKGFDEYNLNTEKATHLLEDIGMEIKNGLWFDKNGKQLIFQIASRGGWSIPSDEISRELTKFGLKTDVRILEDSIYPTIISSRDYDMCIDYSILAQRHPYEGFNRIYGAGQWGDMIT